jgi:predicted Zn-dependent protease
MTAKTRKQQLEEMLAEDPNDPFLRYGVAMEYVGAGDLETAVRCLRELVAVAPDYVPAYQQAGQVLARLGRAAEARAVLRQGMDAAARQGNEHARGEMEALFDSLE